MCEAEKEKRGLEKRIGLSAGIYSGALLPTPPIFVWKISKIEQFLEKVSTVFILISFPAKLLPILKTADAVY